MGDLFHAGHVELLRAARSFGDRLVVGVLSDGVVPAAPDIVMLEFMREHEISVVVHGDDLTDEMIATVYADVAAAGMLGLVPRRTGLSTTEIIRRVRDRGA